MKKNAVRLIGSRKLQLDTATVRLLHPDSLVDVQGGKGRSMIWSCECFSWFAGNC